MEKGRKEEVIAPGGIRSDTDIPDLTYDGKHFNVSQIYRLNAEDIEQLKVFTLFGKTLRLKI